MTNEKLVREKSAELIERIIVWVTEKDLFEIQFNYADDDQWSVVTMHEDEGDREFSLRLHMNGEYVLCLGYYDKDDEFIEVVQALKEEEVAIIPGALKKLMKKVQDDEKGLRISGKLITR